MTKIIENPTISSLPFLKWAGGKRWLVKNYKEFFPKKYNAYIEPFLGSGSVFFHMHPTKAILSDVNSELITTYKVIQNSWQEVIEQLKIHQIHHSKEYYYTIRAQEPINDIDIASRMLYLNRTCFNAIYRVNKNGKFNVPIGTKNNVLLDTDNFKTLSTFLKNATILNTDFESTLLKAKDGDFVYVDPPYTVKHNDNGFVKYNENLFSWDDQIRLMKACAAAKERGAKIMISNADHESIHDIYQGFGQIEIVNRHSVIAASSDKRKRTTEVLILSV